MLRQNYSGGAGGVFRLLALFLFGTLSVYAARYTPTLSCGQSQGAIFNGTDTKSLQYCYCDSTCTLLGDCCADYLSGSKGSCAKGCGACHGDCCCDFVSQFVGKTCSDYKDTCAASQTGTTGKDMCTSLDCVLIDQPSNLQKKDCFCDELCTYHGDCCTNYAETCTSPATLGSCVGHCSTTAPQGSNHCHCDALCTAIGDCCEDATDACSINLNQMDSCRGQCHLPFPVKKKDGSLCYCVESAKKLGNQCDDFSSACGDAPKPAGSCANRCGLSSTDTNGNVCWCDAMCSDYNDCCSDVSSQCNVCTIKPDPLSPTMTHYDLSFDKTCYCDDLCDTPSQNGCCSEIPTLIRDLNPVNCTDTKNDCPGDSQTQPAGLLFSSSPPASRVRAFVNQHTSARTFAGQCGEDSSYPDIFYALVPEQSGIVKITYCSLSSAAISLYLVDEDQNIIANSCPGSGDRPNCNYKAPIIQALQGGSPHFVVIVAAKTSDDVMFDLNVEMIQPGGSQNLPITLQPSNTPKVTAVSNPLKMFPAVPGASPLPCPALPADYVAYHTIAALDKDARVVLCAGDGVSMSASSFDGAKVTNAVCGSNNTGTLCPGGPEIYFSGSASVSKSYLVVVSAPSSVTDDRYRIYVEYVPGAMNNPTSVDAPLVGEVRSFTAMMPSVASYTYDSSACPDEFNQVNNQLVNNIQVSAKGQLPGYSFILSPPATMTLSASACSDFDSVVYIFPKSGLGDKACDNTRVSHGCQHGSQTAVQVIGGQEYVVQVTATSTSAMGKVFRLDLAGVRGETSDSAIESTPVSGSRTIIDSSVGHHTNSFPPANDDSWHGHVKGCADGIDINSAGSVYGITTNDGLNASITVCGAVSHSPTYFMLFKKNSVGYDYKGCMKVDTNAACVPFGPSSNTLPATLEHKSKYYVVVKSADALFGNYRVIIDNTGTLPASCQLDTGSGVEKYCGDIGNTGADGSCYCDTYSKAQSTADQCSDYSNVCGDNFKLDGKCNKNSCGGIGSGGNCYCGPTCTYFGDCCDKYDSACSKDTTLPSKEGIRLGNAISISNFPYKFQYIFESLDDPKINLTSFCPAKAKVLAFTNTIKEAGTFSARLCNVNDNTGLTLVDSDTCQESSCNDPNQVQNCNSKANRYGCDGGSVDRHFEAGKRVYIVVQGNTGPFDLFVSFTPDLPPSKPSNKKSSKKSSNAGLVVGIILPLLIIVVGFLSILYYKSVNPEGYERMYDNITRKMGMGSKGDSRYSTLKYGESDMLS